MNFVINLKSIAPVIVCTTVVCIVGLKIEQTYEETIQKIVYAFLVFTNFFFMNQRTISDATFKPLMKTTVPGLWG